MSTRSFEWRAFSEQQALGSLVRRHAVAERAHMASELGDVETEIARLLRHCVDHVFALDPEDLPHSLVPVPRGETWFVAGDGQRVVCGPSTERVRS